MVENLQTEGWREAAEKHRNVLEEWAKYDIPLSGEVRVLLNELDKEEGIEW